eukprot:7390854-Alexandrium_andersonii.AAC.1
MRELAQRAAAALAAMQAQHPSTGGSRGGTPRSLGALASHAPAHPPPPPLSTADRQLQRGSASRGRPVTPRGLPPRPAEAPRSYAASPRPSPSPSVHASEVSTAAPDRAASVASASSGRAGLAAAPDQDEEP